jgi:hypothetical protein
MTGKVRVPEGSSHGCLSMCLPISTAVHNRPYGIDAATISHGTRPTAE